MQESELGVGKFCIKRDMVGVGLDTECHAEGQLVEEAQLRWHISKKVQELTIVVAGGYGFLYIGFAVASHYKIVLDIEGELP